MTKIADSVVFKDFKDVQKVKDVIQHIDIEKTYLFIMDVNSADDVHFFSRIKNIPNIYFNSVNSIVVEDVLRAENVIYTDESFAKCFSEKGATHD